ncbi:MAG: CsbD family protein [Firmicutes bacterium HGW-Firmicutes-20]|nr:MAG: CsbD family protein [Firmicutes bacterium HGW-Firmicutes-20]PKM68948.1 MAG: CsbD family protein [Firmicutes bacterium HGW-Firmicutes-19]
MSDLKDKIVNVKDKIVGEVKEAVGKATGNEELELRGKLQSTKADFNEKVAEIKEDVVEEINNFLDDDTKA